MGQKTGMVRMPVIRVAFFALIGCLAVAFAALGAGHGTPRASDPLYEAYLLSGGSADDLCPADLHGTASHDCPVCNLVGKSTPPALPVVAAWSGQWTSAVPIPDDRRIVETRALRIHPARGPPVLI